MKSLLLLTLALAFTACAKEDPSEPVSNRLDEIREKRDLYLSLSKPDPSGFFHAQNKGQLGDSLFFTCLAWAGGDNGTPKNARDPYFQWWRHPSLIDVLDWDISRSTISRDPLAACTLGALRYSDLELVESIASYDSDNDGIMGQSDGTLTGKNRVTMTPQLRGLIHASIDHLGGDSGDFEGLTAPVLWSPADGSNRHLQAIMLLIAAKIKGTDLVMRNTASSHVKAQPENAVYQAIHGRFVKEGDVDKAVDILLNTEVFPSDRLPTSDDRCDPYLWNNNIEPKHLAPCPDEGLVHDGTDFIFAASIVLGEL